MSARADGLAAIAHGGALAAAVAAHGGEAADWLDLSTGVSPFPLPLPEMEADVWRRLPDPAMTERVARLAAEYYGGACVPVPTPGSQAVIQLLPRLGAGIGAGRSVAILSPTYGEYALSFWRAGAAVRAVATLDEAAAADIVVLANPNNPDGRRFGPEILEDFARSRAGRLTVVDEAFADMHPEVSITGQAGLLPGLVVLRSFGKFFGMAGLRLGFAFAAPGISAELKALMGPWAVSGPALAIATHAFTRPDLVAGLRLKISAGHALTVEAVEAAGLSLAGQTALFLSARRADAGELHKRLAAQHVLTRAFDHSPDMLRIGLVGNEAEAARLSSALRAASG